MQINTKPIKLFRIKNKLTISNLFKSKLIQNAKLFLVNTNCFILLFKESNVSKLWYPKNKNRDQENGEKVPGTVEPRYQEARYNKTLL